MAPVAPSVTTPAAAAADDAFDAPLPDPCQRHTDRAQPLPGEALSSANLIDAEVGGGLLKSVTQGKGKVEKIEPPSFKTLSEGTLVMGVVKRVTRRVMFVALPFGLSGQVSVRDVADQQLFADQPEVESDEEEESDAEEAAPQGKANAPSSSLESIFEVGQTVRCAVLGTANSHGKKSVTLSVKPSVVNRGLFLEHLRPGSSVLGAVASVEDHGYIVSFGVDGFTGFLSKQNADQSHRGAKGGRSYRLGEPLDLVVTDTNPTARTVTLSADRRRVVPAMTEGKVVLRAIKPGALVKALVDRHTSNGLVVTFLGGMAGVIEHNHLAAPLQPAQWKVLYAVGTTVTARVMTVDYANRGFTLSCKPHLLQLTQPSALPPPGVVIKSAKILRVDAKAGVLLGVPAYTPEFAAKAKAAEARAAKKAESKAAKKAAEEDDEESEESDDEESDDHEELKPTSKADVGQGIVGCYIPLARTASADARSNSNWKLEKEFVEGESAFSVGRFSV